MSTPKKTPCAATELDLLIIRKIDRNCLGARVAVTRIVNNIVGVQIRVRTGHFRFVSLWYRKSSLQVGQEFDPEPLRVCMGTSAILSAEVESGGVRNEMSVV